MTNKNTKVLVAGAAGFIGSHLVEALREKDYSIVCFAHPEDDTFHLESLDLKVIRGDLTDSDVLEKEDFLCIDRDQGLS